MHASAVASRTRSRSRIAAPGRLSKFAKPRSDRRQRAHEAARPQQLPTCPSARGQKAVEPLLVDFVHVQEAVRRTSVKCAILDVLAEHPSALLIAATKEAAAIVAVSWRLALSLIIIVVRHSNSPCEQSVRQFKIDYLE